MTWRVFFCRHVLYRCATTANNYLSRPETLKIIFRPISTFDIVLCRTTSRPWIFKLCPGELSWQRKIDFSGNQDTEWIKWSHSLIFFSLDFFAAAVAQASKQKHWFCFNGSSEFEYPVVFLHIFSKTVLYRACYYNGYFVLPLIVLLSSTAHNKIEQYGSNEKNWR